MERVIPKRLQIKLSRTARLYNSKITRLTKINSTLPTSQRFKLPSRMSNLSTMKYMRAEEVKREIRRADIFLRKGSEKWMNTPGGARVPRWDYNQIKDDIRTNIKFYQRQYEDLSNPIIIGSIDDSSIISFGDSDKITAKANWRKYQVKLNQMRGMSSIQLENLKRSTERNTIKYLDYDKIFKENFIKSMLDRYSDVIYGTNDLSELDGGIKGKIEFIKDNLKKLTPKELVNLAKTDVKMKTLAYEYNDYIWENYQTLGEKQLTLNPIFDYLYKNVEEIVERYKASRKR